MNLAFLHGQPKTSGTIRNCNEDFQVEEVLGFEPDGEGEHLWLWVEKSGQNTAFIGKEIARAFGVQPRNVSHSGMKDRHALTRQWFNLPWPIKKEIPEVSLDNATILRICRHGKKLKIGTHKSNRFKINIKLAEKVNLDDRLAAISQYGVANYFGEQRFGKDGSNVDNALKMFSGELTVRDRKLRSIYLSAARSMLFNHILTLRINAGMFKPYQGDAFILAGSNSYFVPDVIDETIINRFQIGDILLSGAMAGCGDSISQNEIAELENKVFSAHPLVFNGLVEAGLKQERRALQLPVINLKWSYYSCESTSHQSSNEPIEHYLSLDFQLAAGCFATSVLREIVNYIDVSKRDENTAQ